MCSSYHNKHVSEASLGAQDLSVCQAMEARANKQISLSVNGLHEEINSSELLNDTHMWLYIFSKHQWIHVRVTSSE